MGYSPARYDAIADWDAGPNTLLPADLAGQRVLDLACGYGTASWHLARRGAMVTGLDLSARMLDRARQIEAGQLLAPGGWFSFSVFHPCYPGGPEGSWSGRPSWPPEHGYAREGWWTTRGEGVRGRAGANHRMLSTYLNAMLGAGLLPEEFAERGSSVPVVLIARCRRAKLDLADQADRQARTPVRERLRCRGSRRPRTSGLPSHRRRRALGW
jgi:Methyltransferase domain